MAMYHYKQFNWQVIDKMFVWLFCNNNNLVSFIWILFLFPGYQCLCDAVI